MKSLKEQFIHAVVGKVAAAGAPVRVMDIGCGTARYVPALLTAFPNVTYVGVEPFKSSYDVAVKNLSGLTQATVHHQLGYDTVEGEADASCDLVFSLSVLEHIKHLDRFIALSARYAKRGAIVMHRYDLGHALTPHSIKERLHVLVGNRAPYLLPERQFVRYVPESEVVQWFEKHQLTHTDTTYHQMPNHKLLEKQVSGAIIDELFLWEQAHQAEFKQIPLQTREELFPAIAVWGKKRG